MKPDSMQFHEMTITWLDGVTTLLDGGAMFGPVPKPVWSREYPVNEKNQIELSTDMILIQYKEKNYLIDAGINIEKLTDKEKRNMGIHEEIGLEESLKQVGLEAEQIDAVLMTHMHSDHASGLTKKAGETYQSAFPNAVLYISRIEWNEVRHPNLRTKNTYRKENWEAVQDQVRLFEERAVIVPGIEMIRTGGHSNGHSIIKLTQQDEILLHMADIMPTHAHQNPLWVTGYDDYPMDSIKAKQHWMQEAVEKNAKFLFYHDAYYRMIQWDKEGKRMVNQLKRTKKPIIPAGN